ncbi:phosphatase PAP2 family protein [Halolactibacillus miurensis]|uniref:Phosphatase PAP2 family protein n=1 Tax=Halolactibacillus miurensis TaxID=306541 RepID=A0A1I6TEB9_9BACI|nr:MULTISPECIES: phosphatase PAP2 family protein [Halolactibacillus]GEM04625.1 phosphatase PAP2 family protein [Halolactibacillus miurensis]SFS87530.1 undecaprenyl-diphosphatase [Halolactibacillus miurensis]
MIAQIQRFIKAHRSLVFLALSFITLYLAGALFIELAEEVLEGEGFYIDRLIEDALVLEESQGLYTFYSWVTELGSAWFLIVASLVTVLVLVKFYQQRFLVTLFLINMAGTSGLTLLLKQFFGRDRPNVIEALDGIGYSFPSGHATGAMAFYGFLIFLVVISHQTRTIKISLSILLSMIIINVMMSRVFLHVHYFTDVVAGATLSFIWLGVSILSILYIWRRKRI